MFRSDVITSLQIRAVQTRQSTPIASRLYLSGFMSLSLSTRSCSLWLHPSVPCGDFFSSVTSSGLADRAESTQKGEGVFRSVLLGLTNKSNGAANVSMR